MLMHMDGGKERETWADQLSQGSQHPITWVERVD